MASASWLTQQADDQTEHQPEGDTQAETIIRLCDRVEKLREKIRIMTDHREQMIKYMEQQNHVLALAEEFSKNLNREKALAVPENYRYTMVKRYKAAAYAIARSHRAFRDALKDLKREHGPGHETRSYKRRQEDEHQNQPSEQASGSNQ